MGGFLLVDMRPYGRFIDSCNGVCFTTLLTLSVYRGNCLMLFCFLDFSTDFGKTFTNINDRVNNAQIRSGNGLQKHPHKSSRVGDYNTNMLRPFCTADCRNFNVVGNQ